MKTSRLGWKLEFGGLKLELDRMEEKKGQLFSIDVVIGAFLVGIIILAVIVNIGKKADPADIQTEKTGYDIVTLLDYEGQLASLNSSSIENRMNETLPSQYGMRLRLTGNFAAIEIGSPIIQRFVAAGKRSFVNASDNKNGVATFWIWLK